MIHSNWLSFSPSQVTKSVISVPSWMQSHGKISGGGARDFRDVKGKERVPVPVAGPAFWGGVKFVIFYVFSSFLQPAAKIDPIQSTFPPVSDPCLKEKKIVKKKIKEEERH